MSVSPVVLDVKPLGFVWHTADPFLFCVHHDDAYPAGNDRLGPAASLAGRDIGQDFEGKDGWRMYHGDVVPGFPSHPHRGFETVTIVRRGLIDHSDSLGATARFGGGDVQWLTAGKGIVHSEMFPLVKSAAPNPVELFQIWLNLPKRSKMVEPYFTMLWADTIPTLDIVDAAGRAVSITVVAGALDGASPPSPPPNSWAAQADNHLAIWTIRLAPNARWTVPAAPAGTSRMLYFFEGQTMHIGGVAVRSGVGARVRGDADVELVNGDVAAELLLLQGRPIGEPVAQHGPFVMNTNTEIHQAFSDYQRTRFGGWPFSSNAPVHPRAKTRFARHADGRVEER
jgi:redox-sensitive bicupin YhaK (pirin superfamily)